jgi:DDE superfamily endonuclease
MIDLITITALQGIFISNCRIVVEQAFGKLKGRFRILLTPQLITPSRAAEVTFACFALHNVLHVRKSSVFLQHWHLRTELERTYVLNGTISNNLPETSTRNMRDVRDGICRSLSDAT